MQKNFCKDNKQQKWSNCSEISTAELNSGRYLNFEGNFILSKCRVSKSGTVLKSTDMPVSLLV